MALVLWSQMPGSPMPAQELPKGLGLFLMTNYLLPLENPKVHIGTDTKRHNDHCMSVSHAAKMPIQKIHAWARKIFAVGRSSYGVRGRFIMKQMKITLQNWNRQGPPTSSGLRKSLQCVHMVTCASETCVCIHFKACNPGSFPNFVNTVPDTGQITKQTS